MKRLPLILAVLLSAALVAAPVMAEVYFNQVSATQANDTTTFTTARMTVNIYNQGSNEIYLRLFTTADTAAAATTSYRVLPTGHSITFNWDSRTETGRGYIALSIICATGETATVEVSSK